MSLSISEESKAIALRQGLRPGENYRAVVYCALNKTGLKAALIGGAIGAARNNQYGFMILMDNTLRFVELNSFDTLKVKNVFDIPFDQIQVIKQSTGFMGMRKAYCKINKQKYNLIMYVKVGKKLQNQKENVEILDQFLANLKNA